MAACPGGFAELDLCFGGRVDRVGELKKERRMENGVGVVMKLGYDPLRVKTGYSHIVALEQEHYYNHRLSMRV